MGYRRVCIGLTKLEHFFNYNDYVNCKGPSKKCKCRGMMMMITRNTLSDHMQATTYNIFKTPTPSLVTFGANRRYILV
jgi:hypothetical protein